MPQSADFEKILRESKNPLGTSVLLILSWIALSDENLDKSELQQLNQIAAASKSGSSLEPLLDLIKSRSTYAIKLASQVIKQHFIGEKAKLFLEMAIQMSIADGYLLPSENHILRFLADLLQISKLSLSEVFTEYTGRPLPDYSDPSYATYWTSRSSESKNQSKSHNLSKEDEAMSILGVQKGASMYEIKKAYKRLAQIHHPDKFSTLGDEAKEAAKINFQRIKDAYDYLVAYA